MGNTNQICRVCCASAEVLAAVNESLAKRVPLRIIVKESGFSRAGLSRHHRKCLPRAVLNENRNRRHAAPHARLLTQWLDGGISLQFDPQDPAGHNPGGFLSPHLLRSDDVVMRIGCKPHPVRNPDALLGADEAAANRKIRGEQSIDRAIARKNGLKPNQG